MVIVRLSLIDHDLHNIREIGALIRWEYILDTQINFALKKLEMK